MIDTIVEKGLSITGRADVLAIRIRKLIRQGIFDDGDVIGLLAEVEALIDVSLTVELAVMALRRQFDRKPELGYRLAANISLH